MSKRYLIVVLAALVISPAFLYPDIFGNQPDAVADESYFLTSSLQAIQKHTLPGWEFSQSGAYYGGVQTYIDTIALVPVVGAIVAAKHSLSAAELWIALHTGTLTHMLRLVNGFLFLAFLLGLALYFVKRNIPKVLEHRLLLLLMLVLGNSVAVMLAHTAKVWVLYMVFELAAGVLVIAQEDYKERGEEFIKTPYYVGLLASLAELAFLQTFVGVFSTGLWFLWAWWLGHFSLKDVWRFTKRWWWAFVLLVLTQISFFWRAFFERQHGSGLDFQNASTGGAVNWAHRFVAPIYDAVLSQPFILLYALLALVTLLTLNRTRNKKYALIAIAHPLLVYLVFYPALGFDASVRYGVILGVAGSFGVVMLMPTRGVAYWSTLLASGALAFIVLAHSTFLYWAPSYQSQLSTTLTQTYNDPHNALVVDPSAVAFALPLNEASLQSLDATDKNISRYSYLLQNLPAVEQAVSFKPLVLYAHSTIERDQEIKKAEQGGKRVFVISLPRELTNSAEPDTLPVLFAIRRIGTPYVVQSVSP